MGWGSPDEWPGYTILIGEDSMSSFPIKMSLTQRNIVVIVLSAVVAVMARLALGQGPISLHRR
jgi:hypothetical protein